MKKIRNVGTLLVFTANFQSQINATNNHFSHNILEAYFIFIREIVEVIHVQLHLRHALSWSLASFLLLVWRRVAREPNALDGVIAESEL